MSESNRQLNIKFYDELNRIFKIKKYKTWQELAKEVTIEKIAETYNVFGQIFSTNLNRYELLPKNNPSQKLTSIFHGYSDGNSIINNVARYSLYSDEILIFHPLQNPNITSPDYNPIAKPHLWRLEFVDALYFYIVLQKWVRSGIVHLIENPFNFDSEAHSILKEEARKRVELNPGIMTDPEFKMDINKMNDEKLRRSFFGLPLKAIEVTISKAFPSYSTNEVTNLALSFKRREKEHPMYVDFGDDQMESVSLNDSGGSIEMIDAICKLTGAISYTSQVSIKRQLEFRGTNPFWTKFGSLYSGLDLTYLDNVDTSFALHIREENRISGMRKAFREVSSFIEQTELDKLSDDKILHFNDKIKEEVKRSEVEWMKIIDDAKKFNITTIASVSTIGALLDPTKIIVPAIGIPSGIIISEYFKNRGLKSYRSKDAYSVFVDLKNKKPSFYTEFKNCIF
ncbi:hypothetical protein SAMN04488062_10455 [Flavobacterium omnivorum]|uniref:Uncharacterized protein n=1 Tax=Flavobacterium omnivorum TaxID=178355 RepID=A0A1G7ZGP9_9FLAO|nr:hypothetical protein [Flavobacterium omnivorum]SDH07757.1 hypothetical protein SAMN04488062_10455 [Flavobacterium omnivorum]